MSIVNIVMVLRDSPERFLYPPVLERWLCHVGLCSVVIREPTAEHIVKIVFSMFADVKLKKHNIEKSIVRWRSGAMVARLSAPMWKGLRFNTEKISGPEIGG
ncbi:unnamed protein product [Arabis nemorensis]|uniref:Uncharacterized protein n=1 Tax=Arabis nemorensis TaxID=586526 RepID=A0A565BID3_9BRAS|nr:unnamed protein product [Arabis nemorensis]